MHPRSLLRQLTREPLEKPCASPWELMTGGDKVRHCPSCDRDVYSLSDMSELEAELRLLNAGEAVPCVRYARDDDGQVVHLAPPLRRLYVPGASARALVVASAIGSGLMAREAAAEGKAKGSAAAPVQCVMLSAPEPAPAASSAAAAPAPAGTAALAPAPAPPAPRPPIPLGGAPPMPRQQVAYGSLTILSKVPRDLDLGGLKLKAPLALFRMTPGDFTVEVKEPGKKKRSVKFTIKIDQQTTLDLDKR